MTTVMEKTMTAGQYSVQAWSNFEARNAGQKVSPATRGLAANMPAGESSTADSLSIPP